MIHLKKPLILLKVLLVAAFFLVTQTSPCFAQEESCQNDPNFRKVSYTDSGNPTKSCKQIRQKEERRAAMCVQADVNAACPHTCGSCCEDDSSYVFKLKNKVKKVNCNWILKNKKKVQDRIKNYCTKNNSTLYTYGGRSVRDACAKSCDYCFTNKAITLQPAATTSSPAPAPTISPTPSDEQCYNELLTTPVFLKLDVKHYPGHSKNFRTMYISGNNETKGDGNFVKWRKQQDKNGKLFWYLEALPIRSSGKECPATRNGGGGLQRFDELDASDDGSSCNLYNFHVVIYNKLTEPATVHFHGLTPPTNEDGVPLVTNANIEVDEVQRYQFNQFSYAGSYWMHSHWGFQAAFGVATPILLQHTDSYFDSIGVDKEDDYVVMLEDNYMYPKCNYPVPVTDASLWYPGENCPDTDAGALAYFINKQEDPVDFKPQGNAVRLRFINGGSLANWKIKATYSDDSGFVTDANMEILATDGNDVERNDTGISTFLLGLANRIDILVQIDSMIKRDILITAVQMASFGSVTNPVLRHIIIRNKETPDWCKISPDKLPICDEGKSIPQQTDFADMYENLSAAHPLTNPRRSTPNRNYTVQQRGGDNQGGYPFTIFEGIPGNGSSPAASNLRDLYPVSNYTELNHLKYQLHPYQVWRNASGHTISSRRPCSNCSKIPNAPGIKDRPTTLEYDITYSDEKPKTNDTCCWEWCDVPEEYCPSYELQNVTEYVPNQHFIPVCYGDKVRILFINYGAFGSGDGHPIHLHGHDFVLKELYDVNPDGPSSAGFTLHLTKSYDPNGAMLDTIYIPFGKAVAFDFDAYNPGVHLMHCHIDYHLENGMLTTVRYMHNTTFCDNKDLYTFMGGEVENYPTQTCNATGCSSSSH